MMLAPLIPLRIDRVAVDTKPESSTTASAKLHCVDVAYATSNNGRRRLCVPRKIGVQLTCMTQG
jgi:hypothetical protein